jgi:hypothetical protein
MTFPVAVEMAHSKSKSFFSTGRKCPRDISKGMAEIIVNDKMHAVRIRIF